MNYFDIAITTFSKRYNYVEKLIKQIRNHSNYNIILIINGEKDGKFLESYRNDILKLCLNYNNVYPNFFIETRGLSKMWNNSVILSNSDNILILNDDIEILSNEIFNSTINEICSKDYTGLTRINMSFSHFIINKVVLHNVGYFDERLLGFGEEDGDIIYRFLKNNIQIRDINVNNLCNITSNVRHDHIIAGIGKYSNFNRNFIYEEKYKINERSGHKGIFDNYMEEVIPNIQQYPYEIFFRKNKNRL